MAPALRFPFLFSVLIVTCALLSEAARADVPTALEVPYSEAVLAVNERDCAKATKILNDLISRAEKVQGQGKLEFLELKALCMKNSGDDAGALKTYGDLIKAKLAVKRPRKELAPYYFEAGVIYFKQGKSKEARPSLEEAYRQNFNRTATQFFLGNIAFKEESWSEAEKYFRDVGMGEVAELKPAAAFYLGKVAQKQGDSSAAYDAYSNARRLSRAQLDDASLDKATHDSASEINRASEAALAPFDRESFFGMIGFSGGYDTNVLAVPDTSTSADATGKGSVTTAVNGQVGYMTSPSGFIQLVPSYRMAFNFNLNGDTRLGDFFVHTGALYLNRKPLSALAYGLKLELAYTFQNQLDSATDKSSFKPYSFAGTVGPYLRAKVSSRVTLNGELNLTSKKEHADESATETLKRSGTLWGVKAGVKLATDYRLLSPSLTLSHDTTNTKGTEYRAGAMGVELSNTSKINDRMDLLELASLAWTDYDERSSGVREDKLLTLALSLSYRLTEKLSLVSNASYLNNVSNLPDTYGYKKLAFTGGATLTF